MKVLTVVGARPQFIKAAAVSRIMQETSDMQEVLVHTGQHYDHSMSSIFFDELGIRRPDYNLEVGSASHGAQTGRMLEAVELVMMKERPDWVVVYGDTNSTLAGTLAATKLHIPVAHVEAGLRSFNRRMPEEINRVMSDHAAEVLFAPTPAAVDNLRLEGIPSNRIVLVGDVMYDVAQYFGTKAEEQSQILDRLGLKTGGYILATIHRAENTDTPSRLEAIFSGLADIARRIPVVIPLHPRTRAALGQIGMSQFMLQQLTIVDPVGYLDMVMLEKKARLIATDSGGVQKEAFFHRVPCVTLRNETEWVELVQIGWNQLSPVRDKDGVVDDIFRMLSRRSLPSPPADLYGGGTASTKIVQQLRGGLPISGTSGP
ncbi:MAG: non-hydrolyzing UDP-N-acetylglucosamine 2-epimerase [Bacillota bacterium]